MLQLFELKVDWLFNLIVERGRSQQSLINHYRLKECWRFLNLDESQNFGVSSLIPQEIIS
jgi:hypothetical protein